MVIYNTIGLGLKYENIKIKIPKHIYCPKCQAPHVKRIHTQSKYKKYELVLFDRCCQDRPRTENRYVKGLQATGLSVVSA